MLLNETLPTTTNKNENVKYSFSSLKIFLIILIAIFFSCLIFLITYIIILKLNMNKLYSINQRITNDSIIINKREIVVNNDANLSSDKKKSDSYGSFKTALEQC